MGHDQTSVNWLEGSYSAVAPIVFPTAFNTSIPGEPKDLQFVSADHGFTAVFAGSFPAGPETRQVLATLGAPWVYGPVVVQEKHFIPPIPELQLAATIQGDPSLGDVAILVPGEQFRGDMWFVIEK